MKKKFDAVSFQSKARSELSRKYVADRDAFLEDLRTKYGRLRKSKGGTKVRQDRLQTGNS